MEYIPSISCICFSNIVIEMWIKIIPINCNIILIYNHCKNIRVSGIATIHINIKIQFACTGKPTSANHTTGHYKRVRVIIPRTRMADPYICMWIKFRARTIG